MGPMVRGRPFDKGRVARWSAFAVLALFIWSFIAAPAAQTDEGEIAEPAALSAYNAIGNAVPVGGVIDHRSVQTVPVALVPAFVRSNAEVSYPSAATSIAWLFDAGVANSVHGTTTGNRVPTEVTANQPGGAPQQEFFLARDDAGNATTGRYGAGVVRATAERSERPRGFAHGYLANLLLLPAPGSPEQAPGTYDPEFDRNYEKEKPGTFPVPSGSPAPADDPRAFTPNPRGQMGVFAIGSVASTTETFREDDNIVSVAVAEINGINIGNRTADNRCTNCITIDSIRVEARAESNSTKDGALAAWRVLLHRACRVAIANDASGNAYEAVTCLDPDPDKIIEVVGSSDGSAYPAALDPRDPNARGIRRVESLERLNQMFQDGLRIGDFATGDLQFRMFFGKNGSAAIEEGGQLASAFARGLEIQVSSAASSEAVKYMEQQLGLVSDAVLDPVQEECEARSGVNSSVVVPCPNGISDTIKDPRTVSIALGHVSVSTAARPGFGGGGGGDGGDDGGSGGFPGFEIPTFEIPEITIPPFGGGGGQNNYYVGGGLPAGKLKLKINWASMSLKPWNPKDMAKAFVAGGAGLGLMALVRRRLRAGIAP